MSREAFVSALVTLLVTVDPIGIVPIFLVMTRRLPQHERNVVALHAALIAFAVLACFALFGAQLLQALGIGMPALRIAGGLLLFWIAFEMVFETRVERKQYSAESSTSEPRAYIAAFPLAIPLVAGPGAITAVILLAGRSDGSVLFHLLLLLIIALVAFVCLVAFVAAGRIAGLIGATGAVVFSRVLGVILTALAVQFVVDGLRAVLATAS